MIPYITDNNSAKHSILEYRKFLSDKYSLNLIVELENKSTYEINLLLNNNLFNQNAVVEYLSKDLSSSKFKYLAEEKYLCHFEGRIKNFPKSRVVISLCNGMVC